MKFIKRKNKEELPNRKILVWSPASKRWVMTESFIKKHDP